MGQDRSWFRPTTVFKVFKVSKSKAFKNQPNNCLKNNPKYLLKNQTKKCPNNCPKNTQQINRLKCQKWLKQWFGQFLIRGNTDLGYNFYLNAWRYNMSCSYIVFALKMEGENWSRNFILKNLIGYKNYKNSGF